MRAAEGLSSQGGGFDWLIVNDGVGEIDRESLSISGVSISVIETAPSADARKKGRSFSGKAGLAAAQGEYLLLHDDDDMLLPGALEALSAYLDENPKVVAVSGGNEVWEETEGEAYKVSTNELGLPLRFYDLAERNRLLTISTLFRRQVYEDIGGLRTDIDALEDWDLWLRMMVQGDIDVIKNIVARQYLRGEGAASALSNSTQAEHEDARIRLLNAYLRDDIQAGRLGLGALVHRPHARFVEEVDDRLRRAGRLKRKFMPWTSNKR